MRERRRVEYEECVGCGWAFEEGEPQYWTGLAGYEEDPTEWVEGRICIPCAHTFHSWRVGKSLSKEMAQVSECTNLILSAIRGMRVTYDDTDRGVGVRGEGEER